ncbi:hypothetical protein TIFTF001_029984 [Ficus carica]|uniref:Uncharacterized protein n=1 Tax=Ficus carica TaxID=3494 RepID=A0AA88DTA7_FICCA|nr:hypothetical protein TIFTF001_029984 [Ficus carica]
MASKLHVSYRPALGRVGLWIELEMDWPPQPIHSCAPVSRYRTVVLAERKLTVLRLCCRSFPQLGCAQSLLPFHTAVSSAHLISCLAVVRGVRGRCLRVCSAVPTLEFDVSKVFCFFGYL